MPFSPPRRDYMPRYSSRREMTPLQQYEDLRQGVESRRLLREFGRETVSGPSQEIKLKYILDDSYNYDTEKDFDRESPREKAREFTHLEDRRRSTSISTLHRTRDSSKTPARHINEHSYYHDNIEPGELSQDEEREEGDEEIDLTSDEDFGREFRAPSRGFHSTTAAAGPKNANLEAIGHRRNRISPKRLKGSDIGKRLGDLAGSASRVEDGSNRSYLTNVSTFIREIVKLHFT